MIAYTVDFTENPILLLLTMKVYRVDGPARVRLGVQNPAATDLGRKKQAVTAPTHRSKFAALHR